jgi:hypothetical protein
LGKPTETFHKKMPIDYKIALQRLADEKKIEELIA